MVCQDILIYTCILFEKRSNKLEILNRLSEGEKDQLLDAIPYITVLIAGADGEIDKDEKEWAGKLTKIRSFASNELLHEYYHSVGLDFENKLSAIVDSLPADQMDRNSFLSEKLAMLNPILGKLEDKISYSLYKDFKSFAKHVATASGGFFRFGAISAEEKRLIPLTMLDVIEYEEEE